MNVFALFSSDELDSLSSDPQEAFMAWVRRGQEVLEQSIAEKVDRMENDQDRWSAINEERHSLMNILIAAGKRYGIEPFQNYEIPRGDNFGESDYFAFLTDLNHYMTQIVIDQSMRRNRQGVELPPASKEKIRVYIHELKGLIDRSELSDVRKGKLLEKLLAFEKALDKQRFPILEVSLVAIAFMGAPGAFGASEDIVSRLFSQITHVVAEAKFAEDESRQLPSFPEPAKLSPPRPFVEPKPSGFSAPRKRTTVPAFESGGADDDIPF